VRLESRRHRIAEKITWDKHVVAAGWLTWDAGSIPAASTIYFGFLMMLTKIWPLSIMSVDETR